MTRQELNAEITKISERIAATIERLRMMPGELRDLQKLHGEKCRELAAMEKEPKDV
jgi:uncharacterized coiled-coil DUF342 family protein